MSRQFLRTLGVAILVGGLSVAADARAGAQTAIQKTPAGKSQPSEATLKDRVEHRLETSATLRKYDVKVSVDQSVVTLSGDVATAAQKTEAERLAAKVAGVTKVVNNITVDPNEDATLTERAKKGMNKAGSPITDAWITTKVKWFFTFDDALDGSNISVDTNNKVVSLSGTVKSAAQKARAVELAKQTEGVANVVDKTTIGK